MEEKRGLMKSALILESRLVLKDLKHYRIFIGSGIL